MLTAVTGSSGHVGENLIRQLVAQGRPVRAVVHRRQQMFRHPLLQTMVADIADRDSACQAIAGASVVYHLAASICVSPSTSERHEMELVNVVGTQNVVRACLQHRVKRMVHFSSIHALSHLPADLPVSEDRDLALNEQHFAYDVSKARAELEVFDATRQGLNAVIVNPTAVLGPNDYRPSQLGQVLLAMASGKMRLLVSGGYNWVDVRDVVDGAMAAEQHGRSGERYILSGNWSTVSELARIVDQCGKSGLSRLCIPAPLAIAGAAVTAGVCRRFGVRPVYSPEAIRILQRHRLVSCDKARHELKYRPRPLIQTVTDTLSWFRASQMPASVDDRADTSAPPTHTETGFP